MIALRIAIVLAMIGVILCLWLLVEVNWYNFVAFMMVAQPLLLLAVLIFAASVVRELRRSSALRK
jgi:hypothetical protein